MKLAIILIANIAVLTLTAQVQAASDASLQGKISAKITRLEPSGKDCNVRMEFLNSTDKKVNTYQMRNIEVTTKAGVTNIEYGNNFSLKINQTYTRGGLMVTNTACDSISKIQIMETICTYQVPMSQFDRRYCKADVVLQSTDEIEFLQVN